MGVYLTRMCVFTRRRASSLLMALIRLQKIFVFHAPQSFQVLDSGSATFEKCFAQNVLREANANSSRIEVFEKLRAILFIRLS